MSFHPDRWGRSTLHVGKHWPVSNTGCRTPGECDDFSRCIGCMLRQAHEEGAAIAAGIIALGEWARRNGMPEATPNGDGLVACWVCKRLVPFDSAVCMPGVGTQCIDRVACVRGRKRGTP